MEQVNIPKPGLTDAQLSFIEALAAPIGHSPTVQISKQTLRDIVAEIRDLRAAVHLLRERDKRILLLQLQDAIKRVEDHGYCVDATPDIGKTWFTIDERDVGVVDPLGPSPLWSDGKENK